jgi:N-acetylglucosaminyl-diphospho-decaprenol L-rhamnosyltransferase
VSAAAPPPAVAVVTHNSAADLERYFAGQARLARELGSSLIVSDNGSTDATLALVRSHAEDVRLVASPTNLGYAVAVNRAITALPGRDFLLLNPDVEAPSREAVGVLTEFFDQHPRAAVVAPRLVGEDGRPQPSARRFPSLPAMLGSMPAAERVPALRRSYADYLSPSWAGGSIRVDWVIGAAMLIRREAFDALRGWDERFFLYMEDADFCRRCWRAGWETWLLTEVTARHGHPRASSAAGATLMSSWARRRHVASLARFFSREPGLLIGRGRG